MSKKSDAWSDVVRRVSPRQFVPDAAHGDQVLGVGRVALYLLSQAVDERVEGAGFDLSGVAPDTLEEIFAADDLAAVFEQHGEELCLSDTEWYHVSVMLELESIEMHDCLADPLELDGGRSTAAEAHNDQSDESESEHGEQRSATKPLRCESLQSLGLMEGGESPSREDRQVPIREVKRGRVGAPGRMHQLASGVEHGECDLAARILGRRRIDALEERRPRQVVPNHEPRRPEADQHPSPARSGGWKVMNHETWRAKESGSAQGALERPRSTTAVLSGVRRVEDIPVRLDQRQTEELASAPDRFDLVSDPPSPIAGCLEAKQSLLKLA